MTYRKGALFLAPIVLFVSTHPALAQIFGDRGSSGGQEWLAWMPGPVREFLAWVATQQAHFAAALRDAVLAMRDGNGITPALVLIGLSFLYGIFHAVGPGHGKAVVTGYLMARESKIRQGVSLAWLIAGVQAVVAISSVAVLGWILDFGRIALLESMPMVESVSYGLIVLLGIGMTWNTLRGHDCDHDHTGLGGHDHDHDHDDHDHTHGHAHDHHHDHAPAPSRSRLEFLTTGIASGLRPCTGALIVLLFTLATGVFWIGVLSAFAMAIGVSITVSSVGILSIMARRGIVHISVESGREGLVERVPRLLALLGSIAVCLIGIVMLLSSLAAL